MSNSLADFIEQTESVEPDDIPPAAQERINQTLAELNSELYGKDDSGGGTGNVPKIISIDVTDQSESTYEFEAVANDAEDSDAQLSYEWQIDGTVVGDDSSTLTYAFQSEGDVDVTATVTDTDGNSANKTKTVTIALPDPADRFSVDEFKFVDDDGNSANSGQPADIAYRVSDADDDDDILALRISAGRRSSLLTDQDTGAVGELSDTFTYGLNSGGTYDIKLEAMDKNLYTGDPIDQNGDLPNGDNFTGGYADENGSFVTLRETSYTVTD